MFLDVMVKILLESCRRHTTYNATTFHTRDGINKGGMHRMFMESVPSMPP